LRIKGREELSRAQIESWNQNEPIQPMKKAFWHFFAIALREVELPLRRLMIK
jgi:hypothetical protein